MNLLPVFNITRRPLSQIASHSQISSHDQINKNPVHPTEIKNLIQNSQFYVNLPKQAPASKPKLFRNSLLKKKIIKQENKNNKQQPQYRRYQTLQSESTNTMKKKFNNTLRINKNKNMRRIKTQNSQRKQIPQYCYIERENIKSAASKEKWELSLREWKLNDGNVARVQMKNSILKNLIITDRPFYKLWQDYKDQTDKYKKMKIFGGIIGHKAPISETTDHFKKKSSKYSRIKML